MSATLRPLLTALACALFGLCVDACASSSEGTSGVAGQPATGVAGEAGSATASAGGAPVAAAGTTESEAGSVGSPAADGGAPDGAGGSGGAVGQGGGAGATPLYVLPAYFSNAANVSTTLGTRNAGHQFTVTGSVVRIRDLGVWDSGANGLVSAHTVSLFSIDKVGAGAQATPLLGASVTVPKGKEAPLEGGFRYAPLPAPVDLEPGNYAVVAYGLNDDDLPGVGVGLPLPATGITDAHFDPFQFVTAASPAYPNGGDGTLHANASFRFESKLKPLRIMPWGASITDGYLGTMAGYRGPLFKLLEQAQVAFQFVGSTTDNPGTVPLPREQQAHEGHSGFVIQAGTSGRAGIWDARQQWLGLMGSEPDLLLILIGTNDVALGYQLDTVSTRLDALVSSVLDARTGLAPRARVIIAQLPPINDAKLDAACVKYNQAIVSVVQAHRKKGEAITTVDMHAVVAKSELADTLHPNDVGYAKMAKVWFDAIQAL